MYKYLLYISQNFYFAWSVLLICKMFAYKCVRIFFFLISISIFPAIFLEFFFVALQYVIRYLKINIWEKKQKTILNKCYCKIWKKKKKLISWIAKDVLLREEHVPSEVFVSVCTWFLEDGKSPARFSDLPLPWKLCRGIAHKRNLQSWFPRCTCWLL